MSSVERSSDLSAVFDDLREDLLRFLPKSSDRAWIVFKSAALLQISYASSQNLPYAFFAKQVGINDLSHMIESRVTYLEATVIALVATVASIAFALFYTGLTVATLGLSRSFNFSMRKHWQHVAYGTISTTIGVAGVIWPYAGAGLNVWVLYKILNMLVRCYHRDVHLFERPLIETIQGIWKKRSPVIYNFTREKYGELDYQKYCKPSLDYIGDQIVNRIKRMDDLVKLALDVRSQWPRVGFDSDVDDDSEGNPAIHTHYV